MAIQIKKLTNIALVNITSAIQASEQITFSSVLAHPNAMDGYDISNATSPSYGQNDRYSSKFVSISREGNNIRAVVEFDAEEGAVGNEYKTFFLVASYEGVQHCFAGMTTGSDDGIYLPGEGDAVSPVYVEFHIFLTSGAETIFIPSSAATPSFKDLERMVTCHSAFDNTSGEDQWIYGNKSFYNTVTCTSFNGSSISLAFGDSFGCSVSFNEISGATEAPYAKIIPNSDYTIDLGDHTHCYNKVWTKNIKAYGEIEGNLTGTANKAKADGSGNVIISSYGKTLSTDANGKRITLKSLDGTGLSNFDPKEIIVNILRGLCYGSTTYGGVGSIGLFIADFHSNATVYDPGMIISGSDLYKARLSFNSTNNCIGLWDNNTSLSAGLTGTWVLLNHVVSGRLSDGNYANKSLGLFLRIS